MSNDDQRPTPWARPGTQGPRAWQDSGQRTAPHGTPQGDRPTTPYGPGAQQSGYWAGSSYVSPQPGQAEPGRPDHGPHGHPGQAFGGPSGPSAPGRPTKDGDRRRPGWGALVGVAAGAALLASVGTAGLTGAFDEEPAPTATTSQSQTEPSSNAAPVVTSTTNDPDWASVAAAVRPSVVAIDVRTAAGSGSGSGFVLDKEGHILTNDHVVGDAVDGGLVVTLSDGRMYQATIAGTDPATDLAVITLTDPPDDLKPATLGDSEEVVVGDAVVAVGNPLGLSSTVTTGIVSALDRPVTTSEAPQAPGQQGTTVTTNAIQVDAAINPGNSGGPLFDATGRVIGITSSIASMPNAAGGSSGSIGLGFAIPVNLAKQVGQQLIDNGVAEHAYLGVYMSDGTAEVDGATRAGAVVERLDQGTPAAEAGVRPGDVIVAIDGDPVNGAESLTGYVRQYASGDEVTLTIVRDGKESEVQATLATRQDQL
ncbi:trypsin-like peptidase domain-containing protein [Georgenia sp. EYE_87]|uniref:trypsin-like peptidase domain-containing protein n=1 Tax=Georgenia sp. EYE_87 TaxID=2853448 RepID=UPI002005A25C|nr:trypsin-like peptidase domain-containing protein [Georgenia sp. EYE_87]MCK6209804.1 trypsin-like peptidase domain-containing protein [Georgenia sp. EYE_87]